MSRGRKARVPGHPSSRRREFLLTPAEDAQLEEAAKELDVSVAELIRDAVNDYVAECLERPRPFPRMSVI